MKRPWLFGAGTFFLGWIFQSVFAALWRTTAPAPQWLLLAALAVGGLGRVNTAQTLGFLWGLCLDAQGPSLFGSQGLILAAAGFAAGKLSDALDAERWSTQAILAVGATLVALLAMIQIELVFRWPGAPHRPGWGAALLQVLMNAWAAPVVYKSVGAWASLWSTREGGHAPLQR